MTELRNQLKTGIYEKLYLFYGEAYLRDTYEQRFKEAVVQKDFFDMNCHVFEGKVDLDAVISLGQTLPFIDNYRLILVKDTGCFSGKADKISEFLPALAELPDTTILIFLEKTVDKRLKAYKGFAKMAMAVEFVKLGEDTLTEWVMDGFKKQGKQIHRQVASYFLQMVSQDMYQIENEMHKLIHYVDQEVTKADIDLLTTVSSEAKIFDMTKALGERNLKVALKIYDQMMRAKTEPLMILAMIARQFRLILRVKALKDHRVEDIAKMLETRTFIVRECLKQGQHFKYATLMAALEACLQTDVDIKTGKVEAKLGVEKVLMTYGRAE